STASSPSLLTTSVVIVSAIFPLLALLSVILRPKARQISQQPLRADNWWIAGTWIVTLAFSILTWVFSSMLGVNNYKIDPSMVRLEALRCVFIGPFFVDISNTSVKISTILLYKRIFSTPKFIITAWAAIGLVAGWGLAISLVQIFETDPISAAWTERGSFNINTTAFSLAQAGTSICLDVLVLCLPLPVLGQLHMPTERKIAVGVILWLGAFCVVAAIVRLVLIYQGNSMIVDSTFTERKRMAIEAKLYIFVIIELNCSIIAACLPCLGPLLPGGPISGFLTRRARFFLSMKSRSS
ncbi:hypothetical protein EV356DRAFT_435584, partial [Viridothelium virens]